MFDSLQPPTSLVLAISYVSCYEKHYCSFFLLNSRFWFYLLFVRLLLASHTPAPGARAYDRHSSWLAAGSKQQDSLPPSLVVCFKMHSVRGASSRQGTTTNTPDSFPVSHEKRPFLLQDYPTNSKAFYISSSSSLFLQIIVVPLRFD